MAQQVAVALCRASQRAPLDVVAYRSALQPLAESIANYSESIETALSQLGWLPDAFYSAVADGFVYTLSPARVNLFVQRLMVAVATAGLRVDDRTNGTISQSAEGSSIVPKGWSSADNGPAKSRRIRPRLSQHRTTRNAGIGDAHGAVGSLPPPGPRDEPRTTSATWAW